MPRSKSLRLVIDTNIWISFLISDRFRKLDYILKVQNVQIVFSEELLNEIRKTILKPKLKKYFSVNALEEMLLNLDSYIDLVTVKTKTNITYNIFYIHFFQNLQRTIGFLKFQ